MKKIEKLSMRKLGILSIIVSILGRSVDVRAQRMPGFAAEVLHPIRPSVVAIIVMLSVMFSLMLLVLAFAKLCHGEPNHHDDQNWINLQSNSRFSGIDRKVVQSLPFFQFSSLRGSKEGLECAVCLSRFEDSDILRLLPNCNHAFHMNCIDRWLDGHSSCPLCRHKLDVRELSSFSYSMSLRFSRDPSNLSAEDLNNNLELYIRREEDRQHGSSRYTNGSSLRPVEHGKEKEEELLVGDSIEKCGGGETGVLLHKFKHRIIVSDVVIKNRWSDVNTSDLMLLSSEMLGESSSKRFSDPMTGRFINGGAKLSADDQTSKIKEDTERKRLHDSTVGKMNTSQPFLSSSSHDRPSSFEYNWPRITDSAGKRSMSEIANLSRFAFSAKTGSKGSSSDGEDERVRRLWLPIAGRTVRWLAGRERSSDDLPRRGQVS